MKKTKSISRKSKKVTKKSKELIQVLVKKDLEKLASHPGAEIACALCRY
jgi:hypothetical protein